MRRWAITFGQRYYYDLHPRDPRISGNTFVVVDAEDEAEAREMIVALIGWEWAFIYEWDRFVPQIEKYGLVELDLGLKQRLVGLDGKENG